MIHSSAIVHKKARLGANARVGPYAVIDEHVVMGADCTVGPHAYITGHTIIGARNRIYAGAVIGEAPQDFKYKDEPTRLRIGDDNVFRENVTVHRSNTTREETVIGSNNFLMANAHVGHNSQLGNHIIIANGALLGGHVSVADRVFISGNCLLHQFVRVGTLAMMQGGAGISLDLPPFTVARENNGICGLNVVGLRRAKFTSEQRRELKRLYLILFRGGRKLREAIEEAREEFRSDADRVMLDFVAASRRGICSDTGFTADTDDE
ncbi:MAG TPA: acyl-ACP--UDP-N-acetylglucosamine O-acyltransferase [Methylomirabilota bacterium]|nr:acyl-ACP--UDP-N-acetylglucosamine O-acyltransferase [Methylomirabilota bacterium]